MQRYLRYFVFITHHGTYIDGFAGKQYPDATAQLSWCARDVLESEPRWLRNFFFCEKNPARVAELEQLVAAQPPRDKQKNEAQRLVKVLAGDFNALVHDVLATGVVTEKEAAFALLDQHTFECSWSTVLTLARHKTAGNKIELFYFLPVGWLHRALSAKQDLAAIEAWWGNDDWSKLSDASVESIRQAATKRFKTELGYRFNYSYPIFEMERGEGRVMYYMIHASDHPEAPKLMHRAYRNALGVLEPMEQIELALGPIAGADS